MTALSPSSTPEAAGASRLRPEADLARAHARFGRAAMAIYLAAAAVAVALLVGTLLVDLGHEKQIAEEMLSLETQVRAHYLGRHLRLLADELTRLGLRSEVDLLDQNMEPERSLLKLSHEKSAFFNVGVALLAADGSLLWSEPQSFRGAGATPDAERLLRALRESRDTQIVPGAGQGEQASILYVATPILRGGQFTGALLGAIDLVSGGTLERRSDSATRTVVALATRDGAVIYPPGPQAFSADPAWAKALPGLQRGDPFSARPLLSGQQTVVAAAPVQGTDFMLLSVVRADALFGPAHARLATRLLLGLTIAALPLVILVALLRGSLRTFRRSEQDAVHAERLRALGEAADAIAHEVRNSLNGLGVGLDLILRGEGRPLTAQQQRAVNGLRTEIERLAGFSTQLLRFSKGVVPHPAPLELGGFVARVGELARATAESRHVRLEVAPCSAPVGVKADPALVHVAVANLVSNAIDAAGQGDADTPSVTVIVDRLRERARVRVVDNGPGVAVGLKDRLFEPFVSTKPNGIGIGLALSRNIARSHGGDLVLESSELGAAFCLSLPLEAP